MKVKVLLFVTLFFVEISSLNAISFAFQIMQIGSTEIALSTYELENAMFDYFFSKGVIISNSPIEAYATEGEKNFDFAKEEAKSGGIEYFAELTSVRDTSSSTNPDGSLLENIKNVSWNVVNLRTGANLGGKSLVPPQAKTVKNKKQGLSDFSKEVAEQIYKTISGGENL